MKQFLTYFVSHRYFMSLMKNRFLYIICLISICGNAFCQTFSGRVLEYGQDGGLTPIFGAMLQWKGTAVGGITDNDGHFAFDKTSITDKTLQNTRPAFSRSTPINPPTV